MTLAIMGIGLAGAGKSTVLKGLATRRGLFYVSRDDIAEKLTGNPHHQHFRDSINNLADNATMAAFGRGESVVVDSTFVDYRKRCRKILYLRLVGAERVIGIFFDTPLPLARRRNRNRVHAVPEPILRRQYLQLSAHLPRLSDGFDALYRAEDLPELERREFAFT